MDKKQIAKYVKRKGLEGKGLHSFFFIKPGKGTNINELTQKLINIDGVEELCVTEGTIGYMVKARFNDKDYERMKSEIANIAGKRYGVCVSALEMKKV